MSTMPSRSYIDIRKEREEHNCFPKYCEIVIMSNQCKRCGGRVPPHGNPKCESDWYVCKSCIEGEYCKRINTLPENEGAIEGKVVWINGRV